MIKRELLPHPSREDIAGLPLFEGLPLDRIHLVRSPAQADFAHRVLAEARFIGFDTESKPVFRKDVVGDGPHVVQLATREQAFIVQVGSAAPGDLLRSVIESDEIVKVGFGLKSDRAAANDAYAALAVFHALELWPDSRPAVA